MRIRELIYCVAVAGSILAARAQTPSIENRLVAGQSEVDGKAGPASAGRAVHLIVCFATIRPDTPSDCSKSGSGKARQASLVNLGIAPFNSTSADGTFKLTLATPLLPGSYVWIWQFVSDPSQTETIAQASSAVPVAPASFIKKASLGIKGTDSASRDAGGTAALTMVYGSSATHLGQLTFLSNASYDDKWKASPFTANITHNYSGTLENAHKISPRVETAPYASAYHNNSQGIHVAQSYGFGVDELLALPSGTSLELTEGAQAMIDDLYSPGKDADLFGLKLTALADHSFSSRTEIEVQASWVPVLNQSRAWQASGSAGIDLPLSKHLFLTLDVTDNYFEIAPKTFNKNYLNPSIQISFK